ncbi:MAG: elongation factor Ts [Paludibacteraceae bacterium]|nr:elongation factor Ts [Paludibacteraceae bacterium]MBR1480825.1 elongation factor Ts [Paludibacteraceae bacterium]
MAVTLADIKKLRDITGAGMMDVKKALEEANGDFEIAKDLLRKRGQAIAAKRSDREASEGCVLAKAENGFGAIVAVKCETDFVAKNADFVALVKLILDVAMDRKPADLEALRNEVLDGRTLADWVTERSGVTGEKMELSDYVFLAAPKVDAYNHMGNKLATIVAAADPDADQETVHGISMQVAAMAPIALDADHVAEEVKNHELQVAIDKTKQDEINKAVENAIRKAGINPAHVDSDDHIESNMAKGWITPEQAQQAREIKVAAAAEAEANLEKQAKKIEMIAQGRLQKFLKESTLVEQIYVMSDSKETVKDILKKKNVVISDFRRVTLNVE